MGHDKSMEITDRNRKTVSEAAKQPDNVIVVETGRYGMVWMDTSDNGSICSGCLAVQGYFLTIVYRTEVKYARDYNETFWSSITCKSGGSGVSTSSIFPVVG